MRELPNTMADLEHEVQRSLQVGRGWVITGVSAIMVGAVWTLFTTAEFANLLVFAGATVFVFAEGYLTGFHRCIRFNREAVRILKRREDGNHGN